MVKDDNMRTRVLRSLVTAARLALVGGLLWLVGSVAAQEAAQPFRGNSDPGTNPPRATLGAPYTDAGLLDTSASQQLPVMVVQAQAGADAGTAPVPPATKGDGVRDLLDLPLEALAEQPVRTATPPPTATGSSGGEQVSTTLSRVEERNIEAPGSVYVFTRQQIVERGYRSLGELLQTVPGFTVFHRDLDFVVGVRGFNANDNDKITLLINGQNMNGPHEQDFSLNGPINLDNVERVEVVVGPSSFFQQANTLAATINVITRVVDGVEVITAAGNDLKYSTTVMAGQRWAKDKFINFSFSTEEIRGFDAWRANLNPGTKLLPGRNITGELDQPSFFSVLNGQYGGLYAQAIAYRSNWPELHIDNGALPPINNGHMSEQLYSVFLKHEQQWGTTLTSVVRVDATLKEQTRLNDDGLGLGPAIPAENAVQQSVKQWVYTGETYLRYTGIAQHAIQAGIQVETDRNFDNYFTYNNGGDGENFPVTTLFHRDTTGVGFYVDDEYKVTDRLKLIGGIREDHNDRLPGEKWFTGARAAIIYQTADWWTTKVLYNRAVRMPSDLEALNQVWGANRPNAPDFANLSNPPALPEILSTIELHNTFSIGKARLGTTIYHEELQDFISFFQPHANGGNFRGNGAELTFVDPLTREFSIWANASYNDTRLNLFDPNLAKVQPEVGVGGTESIHSYVNGQGRMIGSPIYMANMGFDYKLLPHLNFSPSLRYFTDQAGVDFNYNHPVDVTIHGRIYFDAALTWTHVWSQNMDVRLSAYNLLNNREPVASQQQDDLYRPRGAEVVLTLFWRF